MTHPCKRDLIDQCATSSINHVLLAEDDPVAQEILKTILENLPGLRVTSVEDGGEALSLCGFEKFDILILDLNLPTIKGNKLVSYVRTSSRYNRDKPIILMSAHTQADLTLVKGAALADAIVSKPLDIEVFSTLVGSLLHGQRARSIGQSIQGTTALLDMQ